MVRIVQNWNIPLLCLATKFPPLPEVIPIEHAWHSLIRHGVHSVPISTWNIHAGGPRPLSIRHCATRRRQIGKDSKQFKVHVFCLALSHHYWKSTNPACLVLTHLVCRSRCAHFHMKYSCRRPEPPPITHWPTRRSQSRKDNKQFKAHVFPLSLSSWRQRKHCRPKNGMWSSLLH